MRVLDLSGHYQRRVEIDTCPHCCLVWFDDTESVRLAGPGIAEFVREIHFAMQASGEHAQAVSLSSVQTCPVCRAALKTVANRTRFGRTTQLECPAGHGYYQTYILYLAEKGFVRPLAWADIRSLLEAGKKLYCADCGYPLPDRPIDACPACKSAIEVIDPTRLAMAIDRHDEQRPPASTAVDQHKCHACGGAIDQSRDIYCPHCHAPVLRHDTGDAAAAAANASELAQSADRAHRKRQEAAASAANALAMQLAMNTYAEGRHGQWRTNFEFKMSVGLLIAALCIMSFLAQHRPPRRGEPAAQAAPFASYFPRFREAAMRCDPNSAVRREALVRQLLIVPGRPGTNTGMATYSEMQAAYAGAASIRIEWLNSGAFDMLQERYGVPTATPASMPSDFFRRGATLAAVERAAFCLPVHEISPPMLAEDGFHIIEVLDAR